MGKLRILAVGDVHIQTKNISDVIRMQEKLVDIIKDRKPDLIVLLGDILHEHEKIHSDALNTALKFIRQLSSMGVPLILIIGNHDLLNNQQFLTDRHGFNAVKKWDNVTVVDKCIHKTIKKHKLVFLPYVPPGRFIEALETNKNNWEDATAIFGHQEFYGCKMGSIVSVDGDKWDEAYPLVITGHIHDRQIPQPNIIYTGTPIQHSFGDTVKKTVGIFTFGKTGKYKYDKVDLGLPKKRTFNFDLPDVDMVKIERFHGKGDMIKVIVKGKRPEYNTFKKTEEYDKLTKMRINVVFKPEKQLLSDIPEQLKEQLLQMCNDEDDESTDGDKKMEKMMFRIGEQSFIQLLQSLVTNETDSVQKALTKLIKKVYS